MRIKIYRKEAKESCHWLNLLDINSVNDKERMRLVDEGTQPMKIFGAILEK
jgi:hypothetical protein